MSMPEIAQYLGVSLKTIHAWRRRIGPIVPFPAPDLRLGSVVRWRPSTIDRFVKVRDKEPVLTVNGVERSTSSRSK